MRTKIIFGQEVQDKLFKGADTLYQAVATTLGSRGRNVGIARGDGKGNIFGRDIIHDGVNVARAIELPDEAENFGATTLREAAQKTVDEVGDGTTVTIVLAHAILSECRQLIATGVNPMGLRAGIEDAVSRLIIELPKFASPITTLEDQVRIATISAEDAELGQLVGETLNKIGADGVVAIEESRDAETKVEFQEGMQLDKGYMHHLFVTDPKDLTATLEDAYVLVTDKDITSLEDLGELLNNIHGRSAPLLIISPNIGGEALPLLVQNKLAGKLSVLCVQAPSFGQNQKNILQDIAVLTNAKYITSDAGHELKDIALEDLGFIKHVTSTKTDTVLTGGKGDKKTLATYIAGIKTAMDTEEQEFDREKMRERYAKLTNGVAVIHVGGHTEIEMRERKERVDDAVHATRAAMEWGIVPGGEIIYLQLRKILTNSPTDKILFNALENPFRKLVENAGFDGGRLMSELDHQYQAVMSDDLGEGLLKIVNPNFGVDVTDGKIKDMIEEGIIDPALVPERALYNAMSVAIALMTTAVLIIPINEKE